MTEGLDTTGPLAEPGAIVLVSCYELGHLPHGVAMAAGFLRRAGFAPVTVDLSIEKLDDEAVRGASLVAISVPMHTALRLAAPLIERVRALAPAAVVCCYGVYAPLNEAWLRQLGVDYVIGGEAEDELVALATALAQGRQPTPQLVSLDKVRFAAPHREPPALLQRRLHKHAQLDLGNGQRRLVGYTETTRGCLDTCRHCPIPAVYGGRFFAVPRQVVLADIETQLAAGAEHITFGDPDFLNGPGHGLAIAAELHRRWPHVTFDFTAQVTHLLQQRSRLQELPAMGCAFVVSAVESLSDTVLAALKKRHRRAAVEELFALADQAHLVVRPTFVTFTPWTSLDDVRELAEFLACWGLVDHVDPVQLSIRLLVPPGSLLLKADDTRGAFGPLDSAALTHRWVHEDPRVDALQRAIAARVALAAQRGDDALDDSHAVFSAIHGLIYEALGQSPPELVIPRRRVPRVTEPWFC